MRTTEAVRSALLELGLDASTEDVERYLKGKGIPLSPSLKSIVSHQRKKLKGEPHEPDGSDFPLEKLIELRALVGEDCAEFRKWLDRIEKAIAIAGSGRALRRFLDVWGVR